MDRPDWLDPKLYPFASHTLDVDGGRMHYVDEGDGPPVVLVHGTPTWSFLYRHLIRDLSRDHRVIAPDHVGFGLSSKPRSWGYRPSDHAANLATLLERLELDAVTLVVHDFGGPIGLSWALDRPERVRAVVLFNTWMWSLEGTPAEKLSRFMASPLGRFLYLRLNFSPRVLLKMAFGDRRKLTREVHRHYLQAFPSAAQRLGPWVLARELLGSSEWYGELERRSPALGDKPSLLLWGSKDPAFGVGDLARWKRLLPGARVQEFAEAGHFVQEEAPAEAAASIRRFLVERAPARDDGAGRGRAGDGSPATQSSSQAYGRS